MNRTLILAAAALAAAAPAAAQTGYGAPSSGEYRAEQRDTAQLNRQWAGRADDDDRDGYAPEDRADYDRARADYRRSAAQHRADLARWRQRVAACDRGVRSACAGYEERYGSYGDGRYAPPPPPAFRGAGRYEGDRRDDRYAAPNDRYARPDGRYAQPDGRYARPDDARRDDRYDAADDRDDADDAPDLNYDYPGE